MSLKIQTIVLFWPYFFPCEYNTLSNIFVILVLIFYIHRSQNFGLGWGWSPMQSFEEFILENEADMSLKGNPSKTKSVTFFTNGISWEINAVKWRSYGPHSASLLKKICEVSHQWGQWSNKYWPIRQPQSPKGIFWENLCEVCHQLGQLGNNIVQWCIYGPHRASLFKCFNLGINVGHQGSYDLKGHPSWIFLWIFSPLGSFEELMLANDVATSFKRHPYGFFSSVKFVTNGFNLAINVSHWGRYVPYKESLFNYFCGFSH